MKRVTLPPREGWKQRLEEAGCYYHTVDGKPYWNETAAYEFSDAEIDRIETAANDLHAMCMDHCAQVVRMGDYEGYGFPPEVATLVEQSWRQNEPYLYGRFDLGYNGTAIKLYEYNADTPTALPEASVWQWHALEDRAWPDQFNSIHESLLTRLNEIVPDLATTTMHFAALASEEHEDWGNLHYLVETALEAGLQKAVTLAIDRIAWSEPSKTFADEQGNAIAQLFKLYPWEWMMADEFGWHARWTRTKFIEPAWKMLLSTKALLPLLWKRHSDHPLLLPAFFENDFGNLYVRGGDWVKKPLLGREGANVTRVLANGKTYLAQDPIEQYDKHGYILQRYFQSVAEDHPLDGMTPVLGVWIVGDNACGLGIREDEQFVTTNASQFVPHYFVE